MERPKKVHLTESNYIERQETQQLDTLKRGESFFAPLSLKETVNKKVAHSDWNAGWIEFLKGLCLRPLVPVSHTEIKEGHVQGAHLKNWRPRGAWAAMLLLIQPQLEEVVSRVCETLIKEIDLEDADKTIKPCNAGGLAGGLKFLSNNLFFKFAANFHGFYESDKVAGKAAMAELKNLSLLSNLLVGKRKLANGYVVNEAATCTGVNIPLACVVKKGMFTIMASSLVPIDGTTLRYGSPDGGKTVYDGSEDLEIKEKAEQIAAQLYLKRHDVCTGKQLSLACDCELHRGLDGKIWMLDTARLLPCNPPASKGSDKILYEFFKLGFLQKEKQPVSADVFSGFNKSASKNADNAEVKKLFQTYMFKHIPQVCSLEKEVDSLSAAAEREGDEDAIISTLRSTINVRHFGRCYSLLSVQFAKDVVLREMIVRCVKSLARDLEDPVPFFEAVSAKMVKEEMGKKFIVDVEEVLLQDILAKEPELVQRARGYLGIEKPFLKYISCMTPLNLKNELVRGETIPKDPVRRGQIEKEFREGFFAVATKFNHPDLEFVENVFRDALRQEFLF